MNTKIKFDKTNKVTPSKLIKQDKLLNNLTEELKKINGVKAILLCGSRAKKTNRINSDYDLFIINDWKNKYIQVVHSQIKDKTVDFLLFSIKELKKPNKQTQRTVANLLKKYIVLFSTKETNNILDNNYDFKVSKISNNYELETIWNFILSNIKKAKSYQPTDNSFAQILANEAHYLIGLFYAKFNNKEFYGFSHSLKYMKQNDKKFWNKYITYIHSKNKIQYLDKLISSLPEYEKYSSKKSLVELDSFVSIASFYHADLKKEPKFKIKLDEIITKLNIN